MSLEEAKTKAQARIDSIRIFCDDLTRELANPEITGARVFEILNATKQADDELDNLNFT